MPSARSSPNETLFSCAIAAGIAAPTAAVKVHTRVNIAKTRGLIFGFTGVYKAGIYPL
jgi:hypothetical protein